MKIENRVARCVVAGFVACVLVGWVSGCGNDASDQFQEYSQLEPAKAAVEDDGTDKTPNGEESPRNVTPINAATNGQANTIDNARASVLSQPPIEAPLPTVAVSDNGLPGNSNGSEPPALVGTVDPSPLTPDGRKPIVDGGTQNSSGNAGKILPPVVPRQVKVLVKERTFKVEGPDKAIRINYDDIDLLKVLNMEPVTLDAPKQMPVWLKGLDGRRIRIRGFMYPSFQETGIPAFLMARDNQICCFGGEAKIYDLFPVIMRKGVTTDYILNRSFDVVGVFHIDTIVDEGELFQLYRIDDAVVIDK